MNLVLIREEIKKHLGKNVEVQINGLRNKKTVFHGTIKSAYPNLFIVLTDEAEKSFSYADVITREVLVRYL